jgi:hypothetical protein
MISHPSMRSVNMVEDFPYERFYGDYDQQRYLATYDYDIGYTRGSEDCQLRSEELVLISRLLVLMIASVLLLVFQPCIRRSGPSSGRFGRVSL